MRAMATWSFRFIPPEREPAGASTLSISSSCPTMDETASGISGLGTPFRAEKSSRCSRTCRQARRTSLLLQQSYLLLVAKNVTTLKGGSTSEYVLPMVTCSAQPDSTCTGSRESTPCATRTEGLARRSFKEGSCRKPVFISSTYEECYLALLRELTLAHPLYLHHLLLSGQQRTYELIPPLHKRTEMQQLTVRRLNSTLCCGHTPITLLAASICVRMLRPQMWAFPPVGRISPVNIEMVVDFPAPLWPRRAVI